MPEALVQCAGVSYFERRKVTNHDGKEGVSIVRLEAGRGDIIEVTQTEFNRLAELGAVRKPEDPAPVLSIATPFGVPVPREGDGVMAYYEGPVMGDPTPGGTVAGGLTPEQAAEFEARARAGEDPASVGEPSVEGTLDPDFSVEDATVDEIAEYITTNRLTTEPTVALAGDNPELADKVLEAELSRDNARQGVVDQLEKISESAEDDGDDE